MTGKEPRFGGRTAIVTGAAHGLGREIALCLAAEGATVWAWDVLDDELEETERLASGRLHARHVDVTDPRAVAVATAEAEADSPGRQIHVLINDAGGVMGQVGRPVEAVRFEDWEAILAVNLTGTFLTVRDVAPAMKRNGHGRIVNVSSGAGLDVSKTGIQAYAAAKAGQIGLTRQLAHELGPFGITVNAIAPGFVRSNPSSERQWHAYGPEGQQTLLEGIALRRLGRPADIAAAVLFLASDEASWITGAVLRVDGGR